MKTADSLVFALTLAACMLPAMAAETPAACSATSGAQTLPLVELYTSEGCDSCPPADRWLRQTFPSTGNSATPRAAVIAFHVDYWDGLGWPDRFATHANTERQQDLVRAAGGQTVYTPQVFVQGRDPGLWRTAGVERALDGARRAAPRARIAVRARQLTDAVQVEVDASVVAGVRDAVVHVALTENGLTSSVAAGENKGVRLEHDHVVRAWQAGPAFAADGHAKGDVRLPLPRERGRDGAIVAFVQERATGRILQSLTLPLCAAM